MLRHPIAIMMLITSFMLGVGTAAMGATQGIGGATSTGTLDVTVVNGINVLISGLVDFNLGTWSPGDGDLNADDNLCIGRNGVGFFGAGTFRINASGDGDGADVNAFALTNGTHFLHYNVYFNDAAGLGGRIPLTPGLTATNQAGTGIPFIFNLIFGCSIENANISIEVPESELLSVPGDNYTGTLTLTLIPE